MDDWPGKIEQQARAEEDEASAPDEMVPAYQVGGKEELREMLRRGKRGQATGSRDLKSAGPAPKIEPLMLAELKTKSAPKISVRPTGCCL